MKNVYKKIKLLLLVLIISFTGSNLSAQDQVISFNLEQANFNNGSPLPSEESFAVTGPIGEGITLVSLAIYGKNDDLDNKPLFQNYWKETFVNEGKTNFYVPVSYKLKGGTEYNVLVNYYGRINQQEYDYISQSLNTYLNNYVDQHIQLKGDEIDLVKRPKEMVSDLNDVVHQALSNYRIENEQQFAGFSDLVRANLETLQKNKLNTNKDGKVEEAYLTETINSFKELLNYEVANHLNLGLYTLAETKLVKDYPTEKTRNILTLHVGYGGVYFDGQLDDLNYGNGGYAGITFPLGNKAFASKFWSNSAIVTGVYFENFEDESGERISGPIFKRPIYVGLGYKVFEFIRITGGVTLLESNKTAGNFDNLGSNVFIRPFIGLQADLNFWADFSR